MTGFNHGMTGAVIALTVKQPLIAVPLAFVSHFFQDMLPHWDYGVKREADKSNKFFTKRFNLILLTDFCFSVFLMIVLALMFPSQKWLIWACMIAAACPDLMWAYYRLYQERIKHIKPKYDLLAKAHQSIQWSQTATGGLIEIAWFLFSAAVILSLR